MWFIFFQSFATALSLGGENIEYRPLRIGYSSNGSDTRTQRRQEEDVQEVEDDAAPNVDIEERGREESMGSSRETGAMSVS